MGRSQETGIACSTGGFKGVFLHGVLCAFEENGFRAGAYAAASSSVIPAAAAAVGEARPVGLDHWVEGFTILKQGGSGMSGLALEGIRSAAPLIVESLFLPTASRFMVAANLVDATGAEVTQGKGARRLGRRLLLSAARGDRTWIDEHLTLKLFDTKPFDDHIVLTPDNFEAVAYASSRLLHAWDIPAWVDDEPFVDAYYTCACPIHALVQSGYGRIIAISTEPVLYRDIFQSEEIQSEEFAAEVTIIHPDRDPEEFGVSYTTASLEGLLQVYLQGIEAGYAYLASM